MILFDTVKLPVADVVLSARLINHQDLGNRARGGVKACMAPW
jgi:hypothetical protein